MRNALVFASILICVSGAGAQSIPLSGTVAIQNSQYETGKRQFVKGAQVRAPFAKTVATDAGGRFNLGFAGIASGSSVRISVVKPGLHVVNSREIENVVLGAGDQLVVVMADPEKLAAAQVQFYRIATESITARFERKRDLLADEGRSLQQRLLDVSIDLADSAGTLGDALDVLSTQRERAMKEAQQLAARLAMVDLDGTSQRYRKAYGCFRNGQVDSALAILGKAELDQDLAMASDLKGQGEARIAVANTSIQQIAQSYGLRSDVMRTALDYPGSLRALEDGSRIIAENPDAFRSGQFADVLLERGRLLVELGRYDSALAVLERALVLVEAENGRNCLRANDILLEIGVAQLELAQYDRAMHVLRRCITISDSINGPDHIGLTMVYDCMGAIKFKQGDMDSALMIFEKDRTLLETGVPIDTMQLAVCFVNLGWVDYSRGDPGGALDKMRRALDLMKVLAHADPAILAQTYYAVGTISYYKGEYGEARGYYEEGMALHARVLGAEHPFMAYFKAQLGYSAMNQGEVKEARTLFTDALGINERTLGPDHPSTGAALSNVGMIAISNGDPVAAITFLDRSYAILEHHYGAVNQWTGVVCNYKAMAYRNLDRSDSARHYYRRAFDILAVAIGREHPNCAQVLSNLGEVEIESGMYLEARGHLEEALPVQERIFGTGHPEVVRSRTRYGTALFKLGEMEQAEKELTAVCGTAVMGDCQCMLYRIERETKDDAAVLERLANCLRYQRMSTPDKPLGEDLLKALKELATGAAREDLLDEFDVP